MAVSQEDESARRLPWPLQGHAAGGWGLRKRLRPGISAARARSAWLANPLSPLIRSTSASQHPFSPSTQQHRLLVCPQMCFWGGREAPGSPPFSKSSGSCECSPWHQAWMPRFWPKITPQVLADLKQQQLQKFQRRPVLLGR